MCKPDTQNEKATAVPMHERENVGQSFFYFQKSSELNVQSHDTSAQIHAADPDAHAHSGTRMHREEQDV